MCTQATVADLGLYHSPFALINCKMRTTRLHVASPHLRMWRLWCAWLWALDKLVVLTIAFGQAVTIGVLNDSGSLNHRNSYFVLAVERCMVIFCMSQHVCTFACV